MSILRNIAIGAVGEGINRMEQKDRLYAEIAVNAGKNYFENVCISNLIWSDLDFLFRTF